MKALLVLALAVVSFVGISYAQTNCAALSYSCGMCNTAPNCSYYWSAQGFYNTSVNGVCTSTSNLMIQLYGNQYRRTVWAYAISESAIPTTVGQYKLNWGNETSLNFNATPTLCYDRQLCYCKPMPPPPPSALIIIVTNCVNGNFINGVSIVLNGNSSTTHNTILNGNATWNPITPGTYTAALSAAGFVSNSTAPITISTNQTITVNVCLNPVPCVLTVNTLFASNNTAFPGVSLTVSSLTGTTLSPASGISTYSLPAGSSGSVSGTFTGFYPQSGSFTCTGGFANVTLIFPPVLNTIIVIVRDLRGPLLPGANISLTGFANTVGDTVTASSTYINVPAGTYTAGATYPGYSPNTTIAGPVTYNNTVTVTIYLKELPCTVNVTVLDLFTNLTISGAKVTLNGLAASLPAQITNAQGSTFYSLNFDAANMAFASATGYSSGSASFQPSCVRGGSALVLVYLNETIVVNIAARDAISAGQPLLNFATIYWNGAYVNGSYGNGSAYHPLVLPFLPITGTVSAYAGGFNNQTDYNVTFSLTNRVYVIDMAPQEFTLFFYPFEYLYYAPSTFNVSALPFAGIFYNNYLQQVGNLSTNVYVQKPMSIGGNVIEDTSPTTSAAFTPNTLWTSTDPSYTGQQNISYLTAIYNSQTPGIFPVDISQSNVAYMNPNFNSSTTAAGVFNYIIPAYAQTPERNLLIPLPFYFHGAFVNVIVIPVSSSQTTQSSFPASGFIGCNLNVGINTITPRYINYQNLPTGVTQAIFEYAVVFGTNVANISFVIQSSIFNQNASNWVDDVNYPAPLPQGQGLGTGTFSFPPADLNQGLLFIKNNATGQIARDPSLNFFITRTYSLVKITGNKKDDNPVLPPEAFLGDVHVF